MSFDEETIKKAWVKRVKEMMPEKGFKTYQDLAYESGVSAGSLNQAMRGMHLPRQSTIDKIAIALGTTSQFLLYGDTMKVVKTVPLFRYADNLQLWLDEKSEKAEPVNYVEVASTLDLSSQAFAWVVDKNDMSPVFSAGDLLILDTRSVDDPRHFLSRLPSFMLAIEYSEQGNALNILFGQACMTSTGFYLANNDEKCPYVRIEEGRNKLVGYVVQLVRSFI